MTLTMIQTPIQGIPQINVIPKEEPVVKSIDKAYRKIIKEEPIYNGVPGATDVTFIQCKKGIPVMHLQHFIF